MIVIIDYGVGNLMSIHNMIRRIGYKSIISNRLDDVVGATKLIFPGMGHFDNCMRKLNQSGLLSAIEDKVINKKIPILGICVGLQMLMEKSEEGREPGLQWLKGYTQRLDASLLGADLKIPHMGWQNFSNKKDISLFSELNNARFYFAHSYHVKCADSENSAAMVNYGYDFTVAIEKENILGVQFHPEKSHRFGMQIFKNFIEKY